MFNSAQRFLHPMKIKRNKSQSSPNAFACENSNENQFNNTTFVKQTFTICYTLIECKLNTNRIAT